MFLSPRYAEALQNDPATTNIHYKMCKKIAQLTKVVFMLNNKNEENECLIEEITSKHEQEITKLREANQHKNVHCNEVIDEGALHRSRVSVLELELGNAKLELESQKKEYEELLSKEQRKQCTLRGQVGKLEKALEDAIEIRNQECKRFSEVQRTWEEHKCPSLSPLINTNQQLQRQLNEANDKLEEKCKETIEVQQNLSKVFKEQLGSLTDELRSKSEQVLTQERTIELLRRTVVESEAALAEAKTDYLEKEENLREQLMQDYERKAETERQRLLQQVDNKADQIKLTYEFKLGTVKEKLKESLEQFRKADDI